MRCLQNIVTQSRLSKQGLFLLILVSPIYTENKLSLAAAMLWTFKASDQASRSCWNDTSAQPSDTWTKPLRACPSILFIVSKVPGETEIFRRQFIFYKTHSNLLSWNKWCIWIFKPRKCARFSTRLCHPLSMNLSVFFSSFRRKKKKTIKHELKFVFNDL